MKKIILPLLVVSCLFLSSCKKELTGGQLQYVGYWTNYDTELTIKSNGSGSYYYDDGIVTKSVSGKVVISGSQLKISATIVAKKFTIDQSPTTDTYGRTYMILSGDTYVKY